VYANLLWSDFEPDEGAYDFKAFEKANHFDFWRREGKHLILRFVMDQPGSKSHRDIPDWLYDKTGKDGQAYKTSYGRGYSPNYENPVLLQAHKKAIEALGSATGRIRS
jgi:beta-galactosidase GanA